MYVVQVPGLAFQLQPISLEMDAAFARVHAEAASQVIDWVAFDEATAAFLDATTDPGKLNDYFGNFTGIWQVLLSQGRPSAADDVWHRALGAVQRWEGGDPMRRAHKGSGYFFWAMNALLAGDLSRGFLLMHQALEEDRLLTVSALPATPAAAVSTLDVAWLDNQTPLRRLTPPASTWVADHVTFLRTAFDRIGTRLSVREARDRLMAGTDPTDLSGVFLFTHSIASAKRLMEHPELARSSEFAGQLALDLFFNLALVIERAVARKNAANGRGMFKAQAEFLSAQLGGALGSHAPGSRHTRAGEVNAAAAESAIPGFEATLGQLLDGTFSYSDGVLCLGADRDLAIAYCVRNRGGHHTAAARIVRERFEQVLDAMLASLCHCVEQLYPACSSV